jgi:hypothetical protein
VAVLAGRFVARVGIEFLCAALAEAANGAATAVAERVVGIHRDEP